MDDLEKAKKYFADYARIVELLMKTKDLRSGAIGAIEDCFAEMEAQDEIIAPVLANNTPLEAWSVPQKKARTRIEEIKAEIATCAGPLRISHKAEEKIFAIVNRSMTQAMQDVIKTKQRTLDEEADVLLGAFKNGVSLYQESIPKIQARRAAEEAFLESLSANAFKWFVELGEQESELAEECVKQGSELLHVVLAQKKIKDTMSVRIPRILGNGAIIISLIAGFVSLIIGVGLDNDGIWSNDFEALGFMIGGLAFMATAYLLIPVGEHTVDSIEESKILEQLKQVIEFSRRTHITE